MSRTTTAAILVCAALAVALFVALRAVVDQRNTITQLRYALDAQSAASRSDSNSVAVANDSATRRTSDLPVTVKQPPATVPSKESKVSAADPIDFGVLRQEKDNLEKRLSATQEELANLKRQIAQPEDMEKTYIGPGTWVNADPASVFLSRATISGDEMVRTINAWQNNLELGAVPFYLLAFGEPAGTAHHAYFRGFVSWSNEALTRRKHMLVTFEPTGLRVDLITINTERVNIPAERSVEHLIRVN